ncbi:hypothetical protein AAYQ05_07355 [Flavobacterium sp. B11]|uniref:hypothetical protein n=1 Tax=Flavobacterium movens TaxID=214860 RepID=UPI0031DEEE70
MKSILQMIIVIAVIFNVMASLILTALDIYSDRYFAEYENIKSFKNKKLYMTDNFLFIESGTQDTGADNGIGHFVVEGRLLSNNSKIRLIAGKEEYLDLNLNKQPLYKSSLTNDFFLRDAPAEYYRDKFISFYLGIYFKASFYLIISFIFYFILRYIKIRRYRLL